MTPDLATLADLSHELERLALGLAGEGLDERFVANELELRAGREREAMAIALSYLLRHRTLGTVAVDDGLDVAVDATVTALRRLGAAA